MVFLFFSRYFPGTAASDIRGQYYSLTCTGLEQHLADCAWSLKKVKAKKEDVMVLCREGIRLGIFHLDMG